MRSGTSLCPVPSSRKCLEAFKATRHILREMASKSSIPIVFPVLRGENPAAAMLSFAKNEDVISATRWRVPSILKSNASMATRAADACEFAALAAKRWRHYRDISAVASSVEEMRKMINEDHHGEYCFHLKVTAAWFPRSLGGAMIRRTWCHHLVIDFLFVHPRISARIEPVKGVGVRILQCVCLIARELKIPRVWGEATLDSAPFYQRQLSHSVDDSFAIHSNEIETFAGQVERESFLA